MARTKTAMSRSTEMLRKCSARALREWLGYLRDEEAMFDGSADLPALRASIAWLEEETARRKKVRR